MSTCLDLGMSFIFTFQNVTPPLPTDGSIVPLASNRPMPRCAFCVVSRANHPHSRFDSPGDTKSRPFKVDSLSNRDIAGVACSRADGFAWTGSTGLSSARLRPFRATSEPDTTLTLCRLLLQLDELSSPINSRGSSAPTLPSSQASGTALPTPLLLELSGPVQTSSPIPDLAASNTSLPFTADGTSSPSTTPITLGLPEQNELPPVLNQGQGPAPAEGAAASPDPMPVQPVLLSVPLAHAAVLGLLEVHFEAVAASGNDDSLRLTHAASLEPVKGLLLRWAGRVAPAHANGGPLLVRAMAARGALFAGWHVLQPSYQERQSVCDLLEMAYPQNTLCLSHYTFCPRVANARS